MFDITKRLRLVTESYTENNYNQFFNPNICHVCKSSNQDKLFPCDSCGMVFYCCNLHQVIHKSSHMEICVIMANVRTEYWESNERAFKSEEEWSSFRKIFIEGIKMKITRDLKSYEIEMMMCVKSCLICYLQVNLRTCNICYSANYCDKHYLKFQQKHKSVCTDLLILLNLNISIINNANIKLYPQQMKLFRMQLDFEDMFTFISRHVNNYKNPNIEIWSELSYIYSDYMSAPLTLWYGLMQFEHLLDVAKMYKMECRFKHPAQYPFNVHIIGASSADITGLPSWELFMHFCSKYGNFRNVINELRVILIEPETDCEWNGYYNVCCACRHSNRKLYFENTRVSYEDYIRRNLYKQANIIITFQAEFNVESALLDIFVATRDRKCPFFFTTSSQNKAEEIINKIQGVMSIPQEKYSIRNKFRSFRPYRNYETGGIYYRNVHLVVFL
ncbi:uncharacterized protein LOC116842927 isoform X1 [Odontomachus brunneus]|uniref:uncharacterized protein LOC116842927 isoform X1 n=1 Tax=Odontomachus brunneus TaxID=486640 RepID=UPI0013F1DACC|nr:uncharacterized protein LOC116842927 isoform X1 [Odontomachus brunneus]XP_032668698.1 uncharacterized protein LOC116842927 isoform X1 [Odontomachus brunneus]XP_032668700.1 uncharacterized protein LOC116842927 isoform X1 [Odontomachus brunneus]XP_032668701.1 uncharacterized protein LOC116842927 isoform X1 [Odontomachus brunneus]XP_032668702.1 uncharacterized protein LOC116842927 isoform X1 [Odontomachus brunneus]XP_032668703.1 uncharacterized protein LOC116842927 isoform X1 [Odontomachus bru